MIDPSVIEQSGLARAIATSGFLYPLISATHIVGIATLFGTILVVDLRMTGLLRDTVEQALPTLQRFAVAGFALAAASGVLLALVDLTDYLTNPAFQAKLVLILIAGAVALAYAGGLIRRSAWLGLTSLALWLAVIVAGRAIAFVE